MHQVVVADDHEILRLALVELVQHKLGAHVCASVGDAQSAVIACIKHHPHLLLLDVEMPGRDAFGIIPEVQSSSPRTKIVLLSAYSRDIFVDLACRLNLSGYLLKTEPPSFLLSAITRIMRGDTVYSELVRTRLENTSSTPSRVSRFAALTPREFEVLRYIGKGMSNAEMAKVMHLSKRTVERHVARLMASLNIHERGSLVRLAYESSVVV